MSKYINFGIDLGTTNSCIACWEGDDVRIFQNNDQMSVTPSAVHVTKKGSVIVGRRALNAIVNDADNLEIEFKRKMGTRYSKDFPASGRIFSAEELSGEVLKALLADVVRQTGDAITSAVITVPAAFGTLQCEATAKAAKSVGLADIHLIQEPIAAAIAYGFTPAAKDQRWLVFDLGGGTLDIAIISTRGGRLTVIEHRGDNFQGGKDIDRLIVEKFIMPVLQREYSLPNPATNPDAAHRLYRLLASKAEQAKITLSSATTCEVDFAGVGEDERGAEIEADITLSRANIEEIMHPLLEKYLTLAREAIAGARLTEADLDRVILVGGPTQMPIIRQTLEKKLGTQVDYSLDPMTVVARGAAQYASMLEKAALDDAAITTDTASVDDQITVKLAYEPVCAGLTAPVEGKITATPTDLVTEVKIDAADGHWTSGWIPVVDSFFDTSVSLLDGKMSHFWFYARDSAGRILKTDTEELRIRGGGLVVSAPPLPHTISVELALNDGKTGLEPIFPKGTTLPAEKTVTKSAARTLRPSERGESLAIKIYEGEYADPRSNTHLANLNIHAEHINRPIPDGAKIEVTISIDTSRLITVAAYVPHLDQWFEDDVYIPDEANPTAENMLQDIPRSVGESLVRIDEVENRLLGSDDEQKREKVEKLREEAEDIDLRAGKLHDTSNAETADQASQLDRDSRKLRAEISELEQSVAGAPQLAHAGEAEELIGYAVQNATQYGTDEEKREADMLRRELERALAKGDTRSLNKLLEACNNLRWRILSRQPWFWQNNFGTLCQPGRKYTNATAAANWIEKGNMAISQGDSITLEQAVRQLWKLESVAQADADRELAMQPGLRQ